MAFFYKWTFKRIFILADILFLKKRKDFCDAMLTTLVKWYLVMVRTVITSVVLNFRIYACYSSSSKWVPFSN